MRRSSLWNIFMILQNLFTKIAKTPARAAATLGLNHNFEFDRSWKDEISHFWYSLLYSRAHRKTKHPFYLNLFYPNWKSTWTIKQRNFLGKKLERRQERRTHHVSPVRSSRTDHIRKIWGKNLNRLNLDLMFMCSLLTKPKKSKLSTT